MSPSLEWLRAPESPVERRSRLGRRMGLRNDGRGSLGGCDTCREHVLGHLSALPTGSTNWRLICGSIPPTTSFVRPSERIEPLAKCY